LSTVLSGNRAALFPLKTVLFPGSRLRLQIFEQRYLRLVKTSLRDNHGFVVVLISEGNEVGAVPEIYKTGIYAEIVDWETLDNGLLGITIEARYRVRVSNPGAQDDGLLTGTIRGLMDLNDETHDAIPLLNDLVETLITLENHPYIEQQNINVDYSNASEVCYRLAQLLPVDMLVKQSLLEIDETAQRAERLRELIKKLEDAV
jgi:Lon protease-like protein